MGCAATKQSKKPASDSFEAHIQQSKLKSEDSKAELKIFKINKNPILQRRASQKSPLTNAGSFLSRNS
ncbi:unnamed protein product [Paramecium sonneborni]|uniref:Uncharacterized protein n=1 Tax=Paramecium sonneborni TaxID=65129 RepID=A0A8S1MXQ1_9CILI|nr:unnamed protein product [Paramecium sonneborni]